VNAEQWNAMYPVGTLVFAYPGFRPEDDRNARRLVTRTRTKAQMSASGDPVVWVDGEGSYICLTHVDPVSESVWQAAKQAEEIRQDREILAAASKDSDDWDNATWAAWWRTAERHDPHFKRKVTNAAAAVAAQGALPVPVGDQPQPLDDTRLAEITALLEAATPQPWLANERIGVVTNQAGEPLAVFGGGDQDHADAAFTAAAPAIVAELLAAVAYHRHWEQIGWRKANAYHGNWVRDDLRITRERQLVGRLRSELSRQGKAAKAEVERLKAELASAREDAAFMERNTLPELRRTIEHHQAGKQRWRERAVKAEARVAELEAERHTTNEALDDAVQALRESHAAPTTTPEEAS
jgi:hypothetical protein